MSGISGWMDFGRDLLKEANIARAMIRCLQHRGGYPEAIRLFDHAALGECQSRTNEVGIADEQTPIASVTIEDNIALVFDGAIFNCEDLAHELGQTHGLLAPTTERHILLRAYNRWGAAFVEKLDGMFAFAIWDGKSKRLLLGRDRMGLKPLYYHETQNGLLFASEPKGIFAHPEFERRMVIPAMSIVLQPRFTRPGETPLDGLKELPPAHVLIRDFNGSRLLRYWQLEAIAHPHNYEETVRRVRELLEEAVYRQKPTGAFGAMLSGGLDSTSVAAFARRSGDPADILSTYCLELERSTTGFVSTELRPEVDSPYAISAAEYLGTRHQTIGLTASDIVSALPETRKARDLPAWGQFDASMYLLFKAMRNECKIALTGEAADEIFGGYPYLFKPETTLSSGFPWMGDAPRLSDYLNSEILAEFSPGDDELERLADALSAVPQLNGEDPINRRMRDVIHLGMAGPLSVILDRKERMSMAHGLEVRIPYCDHRLVEYVWNVPWSLKSRTGVKGLLKDAVRGVVPESTLMRKKSAYPHIQHSAYDRALIAEAQQILADNNSSFVSLFDKPRLRALIEELAAIGTGATGGKSFPGGTSAVYMLVHFVEGARWAKDYRIAIG